MQYSINPLIKYLFPFFLIFQLSSCLNKDNSSEVGEYKEAIFLYQQVYTSFNHYYNTAVYKHIISLEKIHEHNVIQQELLNEKPKTKLFIYISLVLLIVVSLVMQHLKNNRRLAKLRSLAEEKAAANKRWIAFFEHSFNVLTNRLPDFINRVNEISYQSKHKSGEDIYSSLQQAIDAVKKENRNTFSQISKHPSFYNLSCAKEMDLLSDKEKIIYILTKKGFSVSVIAGFVGVTEDNIRASKAKIKKKISDF